MDSNQWNLRDENILWSGSVISSETHLLKLHFNPRLLFFFLFSRPTSVTFFLALHVTGEDEKNDTSGQKGNNQNRMIGSYTNLQSKELWMLRCSTFESPSKAWTFGYSRCTVHKILSSPTWSLLLPPVQAANILKVRWWENGFGYLACCSVMINTYIKQKTWNSLLSEDLSNSYPRFPMLHQAPFQRSASINEQKRMMAKTKYYCSWQLKPGFWNSTIPIISSYPQFREAWTGTLRITCWMKIGVMPCMKLHQTNTWLGRWDVLFWAGFRLCEFQRKVSHIFVWF